MTHPNSLQRSGTGRTSGRAKTAEDYLRFAVTFAQMPLATLRARHLATVERDVQRLLYRTEWGRYVRPGELKLEVLQDLQRQAARLLCSFAEPRATRFTVAGDLHLSFWAIRRDDGRVWLAVLGSPQDRFRYQLVRLLGEVDTRKLLLCTARKPRPETGVCGRLFFKVTRKEYCSTTCQTRMYMRGWRAEERKGSRRGKTTRKR
jgi:hypothetical protein